jgi:hypothetical protein
MIKCWDPWVRWWTFGFHKMRGIFKLAESLLASQALLLHRVITVCVGYCVLEFRYTLEFLCSQFGLWFLFGTRLFAPRKVSCLLYLFVRHLLLCFNNSYNIIKLFDIRYRAKMELTNQGYYVPGLILLQICLYISTAYRMVSVWTYSIWCTVQLHHSMTLFNTCTKLIVRYDLQFL